MKGLMICHRVRLPYRVMRCMSEAGVEVYVLGNEISKGLRHSHFCRELIQSQFDFDGSYSPEMADEINRYVRELGIDVVFPGDAPSSRSFHGVKHLIQANCYPGPTLEQFDLLNNKWEFAALCEELEILSPRSRLYESRSELEAAIRTGDVSLPSIAKPVSMDGSQGVVKLSEGKWEKQLAGVEYAPILVQPFIEGEDIGASVYCKGGEIETIIVHKLDKGVYETFHQAGIHETIYKISSKFKLDGVYNFDMRATANGDIYYLECNPRFFFKMYLSMVAGINFAVPGLQIDAQVPAALSKATATRTPRAWPSLLVKPWSVKRKDLELARFLFRDSVNFMREVTKIDND
ncbi:MAG TPA: ATP-grasp domain-containing protein [Fimbriimonas sp.]|nr:ATP-grasp domain-containing protein [Fimbriimonas sp.]